ncbi:hypothetical protein RDE2_13070 [Rhodococcus sp. RDE2]|nr:hypothetical protein RDE2_13070 [Rhodococcus sp. RDE2]
MADRVEARIGPVAEIASVQIGGEFPVDLEIADVHFLALRREQAAEVRMVCQVDRRRTLHGDSLRWRRNSSVGKS